MLIPGLILRARALFLTGTTTAVIISLLAYTAIVSSLGRDGGLFGLGHLFSVPGMFLGTSVSAWLLSGRMKRVSHGLLRASRFCVPASVS